MANVKTSAEPDGAPLSASDNIRYQRGASNVRGSLGDLAVFIGDNFNIPAGSVSEIQYHGGSGLDATKAFRYDSVPAFPRGIILGDKSIGVFDGSVAAGAGIAGNVSGQYLFLLGGLAYDDGVTDADGGGGSVRGMRGYRNGSGGGWEFIGGDAESGSGGSLGFYGGNSTTGNGGDLYFDAGLGGSDNGNIFMGSLPTSDPGLSGALWADNGVVVQSGFIVPIITPGGSDGDIQFNLTGAFAGNATLNWEQSSAILTIGVPADTSTIKAPNGILGLTTGANIEIVAGDGYASGITSGGGINIISGSANTSGDAGPITIQGGSTNGGIAASVTISGGSQSGSTAGGSVILNATIGSGQTGGIYHNTPLVYSPGSNRQYFPAVGASRSVLPNTGDWKPIRIYPGSGSTITSTGIGGFSTTGTIAHPVLAGTNYTTRTPSYTATSAAAAGSLGNVRGNVANLHRNTGLRFEAVFGQTVNTTGYQFFAGLYNTNTNLAGDPSALTNMVGLGYDAADANNTNWFIMHNDNVGTATRVGLGASFIRNTTSGIKLILNLYPNTSNIDYYVRDMISGVSTSGTLTTNLPVSNTFLNWQIACRNGAVAASTVPWVIGTINIDGPIS